jgi:type I protein arginine methyltransferase
MIRTLLIAVRACVRWIRVHPPLAKYFYDLQNAASFNREVWHEAMLADKARVDTYATGIERSIQPGDTVVDLGTGTGILAFLAARRAARVYAIEHSPIIETAQRVAAANGIANVEFVHANSRDFTPPERVDAIVHEQIGGENPFSENMLENLLDARRRMLKPGGRIVPNRFEIFLEPVELKADRRMPLLWEFNLHGIDYAALRPAEEELPGRRHRLNERQRMSVSPNAFERFVCMPHPLMELDLETAEEAELPHELIYESTAVIDGQIDGLYFYFRAELCKGVVLDTSPELPSGNWAQVLYRVEQTPVRKGETVSYRLKIGSFLNDLTWQLQWQKPAK